MKKSILTIGLLLIAIICNAQNYEFGEVTLDEVNQTVYDKDSTAVAVYLHKSRKTKFNHEHPAGWVIETEVHERIKILNKDGLGYGTKKIRLYRNGGDKERIYGIKAYTYNNVDGKLKSEKLKKNGIFKEEESKNVSETSFTMPNVQVGSVVEWTYKVVSPFWTQIDDLVFQEDIPIVHYYGKIQTLAYFNFQRIVKGSFDVRPKEYQKSRNLNIQYETNNSNGTRSLTQATKSSTITTQENVSEYELHYVPALKEEIYVDNVDNYRGLITYELTSTQFPNSGIKKYSNTWDDVVKTINKSDNFGGQLKKSRFLKEEVDRIKGLGTSHKEIVNNAFSFVKDRMTWDGKERVSASDGIQKAFKERTGNSAQINLMLTVLLRECGVKANPVLVSTRDNGFPVFPTLDGFNYVVVCAEVDGKEVLLDATEKLAAPGDLPLRAINWEGTVVQENDKHRKISMYPRKVSLTSTMISVSLSEDGSLVGKERSNYTSQEALNYRKAYERYSKEEYEEELINTFEFDELVSFDVSNIDDLQKPVSENIEFEYDDALEIIGDEIYFSPLFFLRLEANPFKLEDRSFPVNFGYPFERKKMVNIKIPEGYEVKSLPQPIKMALPDNMGTYIFAIGESPNGLSVRSSIKLNATMIPVNRYQELKQFYNQRVAKESEKVVLSRKP